MPPRKRRAIIAIIGIPVMILGLIGWVLPVIPGAPLFFLGLAMSIGWHPKGEALVSASKLRLKELAMRLTLKRKSADEIKASLFDQPDDSKP